MKANRGILTLALVLLLVLATACEKSFAPVKKTEPTNTAVTPAGATNTPNVLDQMYLFQTQTAMASQGLPIATQPPGGLTPVSPATPIPGSLPSPTIPIPVFPSPTPGVPAEYTLQQGEFPYCIARRFNVNPAELLSLNGLTSASASSPGMTLKIPQSGNPFPGNRALIPHPTTYVVKSGDTIYKIACAFGDVDPLAIAFVNNLQPPYQLTPGQTLHIP